MKVVNLWAPRVNPIKIRRLYRYARLGIYDDDILQVVGWELYVRCNDIATVADVFRDGRVPCPQCQTKVKRKIDPLFKGGDGGTHVNWFHCPHCSKRLLWQDCRDALRKNPRCFDCRTLLTGTAELTCTCGKKWEQKTYRRSLANRVRLPCPNCLHVIRRPEMSVTRYTIKKRAARDELQCPRCNRAAIHEKGSILCHACGYQRRWRDYRKSLKRRDEKLECTGCGYTFRWQAWRKSARSLRTGNPQPARQFAEGWPRCRTPQARMIQIDTLLQALHGRGALAPLFIDGNEQSIREMLDEFAVQA